jgi:diguanylate cyclase (GGDEF)-like protein
LQAPDGDEAWRTFLTAQPDVVITDRMMPKVDGLELVRRIRGDELGLTTYIVLTTAMGAQADILAGMESGADDYLTKPVDPFDLQTRLIAADRTTRLHRQLMRYRVELERLNADLAEVARTDSLTGAGNRRRLDEDLVGLHSRSRRHGWAYSVAMFDIDWFKAFNDTYGHLAGDDALRAVAQALVRSGRASDNVYRYGGEEFVVVLADESDGACLAVERWREAIQKLAIPHEGSPFGVVTVSAGVATAPTGVEIEAEGVVARADAALYEAKQQGRNRVCACSDTEG